VADMNRVLEVEMCCQRRQVVGIMIHVVAVPGLAGTPMAPPVMSDHAVATLAEEQHLCVPIVRRKRPAVTKDDRLAFSPVLVVNLNSILRSNRRHEGSPYRLLRSVRSTGPFRFELSFAASRSSAAPTPSVFVPA